ncbi:hypothetical protein TFLX_02552 [Thermoflexales bacterium]|nr:hypothetical protein TFLX_02552 [Thermoflexales bacterium]
MPEESIVDTSRPNAGRIYDYLLGGSHNFEVDRQAAEGLLQRAPFLTKFTRLQRWALQDLATQLTEQRGFDVIIDFASGLPTNDHIHHVVPTGTTVIYSDYDPVVVEYAHELLTDTPNVYYFESDARRPDALLNRAEVQQILKGRRNVALVYWGISVFLPDEDLANIARTLYDWTDKRSCWAYNAQGADVNLEDPVVIQSVQFYKQMGTPVYIRPLSKHQELVQPWHSDEKGFIPLLKWHGLDQSELSHEDEKSFGPMGGGYGSYLVK